MDITYTQRGSLEWALQDSFWKVSPLNPPLLHIHRVCRDIFDKVWPEVEKMRKGKVGENLINAMPNR